jgi:hypothetical protein
MNISLIAPYLAMLLSVVYVILAIVAFANVDKSKTVPLFPRLLALTFWWPYYDIYDASVRKICIVGKIILPVAIIAYVMWFAS